MSKLQPLSCPISQAKSLTTRGTFVNPFRTFSPPYLPMSSPLRRPKSVGLGGRVLTALVVAAGFSMSNSAAAGASKEEFVKKIVSSNDVVIFSKSYCPYCSTAKALFKKLDKMPYVIELDEREDGDEIQDALIDLVERHTVPQVFVKGQHIGGCDDTVEVYQSGVLKKLLGV